MTVSATTHATAAQQVRQRVLASKDRFWRPDDFDGSTDAVGSALRRLVASDELLRVRRGLYWRGRKTKFGMTRPPMQKAIADLIGAGEAIGATGWHATNLLGLSTQVSPVEMLAVTKRPPSNVPNVRFTSRAGRTARRTAHLNALEVTVLEALDGWERYVEIDAKAAVKKLLRVLEGDEVRVERLVRASHTEPAAVRERLRAVLHQGGRDADADGIRAARDPRTTERALRVLEHA